MAIWRVGADRDLPIVRRASWDGAAAKRRIFAWAGFDGDNPNPAKARRAFLLYDSEEPKLKGSYKLPFADVVDGQLVAVDAGLRAAASYLPKTDAPPDALRRARAVLDAYFGRNSKGMDFDGYVAFGDQIKAIESDDGLFHVASYGIRFGSPEERDIEGDWFAPDTDYGPNHGDGAITMFHHGIPLKAQLADLAQRTFSPVKATMDEIGIFVEAVLDLADEYQAAIAKLVKAGKLRWSSGTASHLIQRDEETGKLKRWYPIEWSYTPAAAEPRLPPIAPIKALVDSTYPDLEVSLPEGDANEASSATTTAGNVTVNVYVSESGSDEATGTQAAPDKEIKTMEVEENKPKAAEMPVFDAQALSTVLQTVVTDAISDAVKAVDERWEKRLGEEPPLKKGGVVITEDEADRKLKAHPFKSLGEMLMAVRDSARGITDPRLLPLRSGDPADEGGFNIGKALGNEWVGSLTNAALIRKGLKSATGMQEGIPSAGGFAVGTDQAPGILARVYEVGELLRRIDMVGISANSNSMTFLAEAETSRADGSRRGGIRGYWLSEAGSYTASKPKFREMNLKLKKAGALVYATDELLADASALESYIMQNLPEELRFIVEDAIINGEGSGTPLGVLKSDGLVTQAKETGQAANTVVAENLVKMWSRLYAPSRRNAIWLISQDVEPQLYLLNVATGTGGQLVYMPPGGLSATPYGTLFGRPVIPHESCASLGTVGDVILLDPSQYQGIEKGSIESASSIHVNFTTGEQVFRFTYRFDGQPKWNSALTPHNSGATVSPYVALATRA